MCETVWTPESPTEIHGTLMGPGPSQSRLVGTHERPSAAVWRWNPVRQGNHPQGSWYLRVATATLAAHICHLHPSSSILSQVLVKKKKKTSKQTNKQKTKTKQKTTTTTKLQITINCMLFLAHGESSFMQWFRTEGVLIKLVSSSIIKRVLHFTYCSDFKTWMFPFRN